MEDYLQNLSHKRFNILTNEWVLVSPHRTKRPWQGQEEELPKAERPTHDLNCYLCAGNTRANGEVNPNYEDVFIFKNDFAALTKNTEDFKLDQGLLMAETESGICKVVCFSPDHSKSLAQMSIKEIEKVIYAWQQEYKNLGKEEGINYVQIFENKGEVMGCSNPHPHGQIWSQSSLPNEVVKKDKSQYSYFSKEKNSLLGDYLKQELKQKERIIFENRAFVVLVPFWAIWPYEAMIIPKMHQTDIYQIPISETILFAEAISVITRVYDKLFNCSFPYSSGIHQAPTNESSNKHWHWHMSFYPPLLRSATVKKFMVGYEMFGSPQRDITAEFAANVLRDIANKLF
ncbi:UDP-glucose--hexose-1-phosphate uridylyltransferase [Winogradskyella echinorum]|uniref:Galactose-1-phosphate uridylyltransferase n=1 Tax=Winogradskyella echinorum TaxID=538189 RepID=A0ABR6XZA4_9FLAO|nr:UDP-glucose--hexose-1-phosphate uridylyltransferase [Winogradskyella echinorum]MBC3845345.1 UDP-glucose--hexose-1-phosphate uridylyltransferase [Winogradskyella echinorum]MBC5749693.1 UDP-glucose--hexose-1-phosphate uridylyltransferase [Winogradskyella echinorum]